MIIQFIDFILHIDEHLSNVIQAYGILSYFILFAIIFMETGFVVTPFLPGDSLLFAAGTLAASGSFNIMVLYGIVLTGAVLGDTVNYWIGHSIGPKAFSGTVRFFKKKHLEKTHEYFEKYGGKTVIIARFVPIVRTFAPFVAGVGAMTYSKFIFYNVIGGLLWVSLFVFGGFFFGNIPIVKENFELMILGIIVISVLPAVIEYLRNRQQMKFRHDTV